MKPQVLNSIGRLFVAPSALVWALVASSLASIALGDDRRDNRDMMQLVEPVVQQVQGSVVKVFSGPNPVALGTIVSEDGYVLTKRSELSGDPIQVQLSDKRMFPARVSAVRRHNDLAMLRIDADVDLQPVEFAEQIPPVASFLISPGRSARAVGIGIVGVKKARRVDHQGRLGVMLQDDASGRALVNGVWPRSGADAAGIEPGDLIVAINGKEENSRRGVVDRLRGMFPGESVKLTILRPNGTSGLETLQMNARIRDLGVMRESESDSMVNGPRSVRLSGFEQVIQHDTVLDPDQCGGPVLDSSGRVVGINIARAGRVVSYALPSSLILPEMISMLEESRALQ